MSTVNSIRSTVVLVILSVLLGVIVVLVLVSLLNAFASDNWKPQNHGCYRCIQFVFTTFTGVIDTICAE